MYLSDVDIKKAVENGDVTISDFDPERLQPASYDIRLGNKFWVVSSHDCLFIDPVKKIYPTLIEKELKDGEEYFLHPGVTVLGTSKDYFGSNKYLVHLSGKSSLARLGLVIHNTAGIINPGHFLNITFELANFNKLPMILRPGMAIGQILFSVLTSEPKKDYKTTGRYFGRDHSHFADPKETEKRVEMKSEMKKKTKSFKKVLKK
jgi:dCTP deaminase